MTKRISIFSFSLVFFLPLSALLVLLPQPLAAEDGELIRVSLQSRAPSAERDVPAGTRVIQQEVQHWKPQETAIIICDMWNQHWCQGATARVAEMVPRMNEVLTVARGKGVTVIHAPSECMAFYEDSPARKRIQTGYDDPEIRAILGGREAWNNGLPSEQNAAWPIDQRDGGCDCEPKCRQGNPWRRQIETLVIDEEKDLISDSGIAIGSYLKAKEIKNVILMGVHTNMCVIGRPFGLRQQVRFGNNVALMRDLTDTMYNSKSAPHVSHFTGNSLIQEYIETYVSPSMVSTDFTGEKQFRFKEDTRPVVAFITADDEYRTNQRFHEFANELLLKKGVQCDFAAGLPSAQGSGRHNIENLQILQDADIVFLAVRRRALEAAKMSVIKDYAASGKPLVGLRTASHAFSVNESLPASLMQWREFDNEVLGGNYAGHHRNVASETQVSFVPGMESHPLLREVEVQGFSSPSWLYRVRPLPSPDAQVLLLGSVPGRPQEPVLWINKRPSGDVIYTSLGHWDDWIEPNFKRLMTNIVDSVLPRP